MGANREFLAIFPRIAQRRFGFFELIGIDSSIRPAGVNKSANDKVSDSRGCTVKLVGCRVIFGRNSDNGLLLVGSGGCGVKLSARSTDYFLRANSKTHSILSMLRVAKKHNGHKRV